MCSKCPTPYNPNYIRYIDDEYLLNIIDNIIKTQTYHKQYKVNFNKYRKITAVLFEHGSVKEKVYNMESEIVKKISNKYKSMSQQDRVGYKLLFKSNTIDFIVSEISEMDSDYLKFLKNKMNDFFDDTPEVRAAYEKVILNDIVKKSNIDGIQVKSRIM